MLFSLGGWSAHPVSFFWSLQLIRGSVYLVIMILGIDHYASSHAEGCTHVFLPPGSVTGKPPTPSHRWGNGGTVRCYGRAGVPSLPGSECPSQICTDSWRWCFPQTEDGPSVKSLEVAVYDPHLKTSNKLSRWAGRPLLAVKQIWCCWEVNAA